MAKFLYDNNPVDDIEKFHSNKDLLHMSSACVCVRIRCMWIIELTKHNSHTHTISSARTNIQMDGSVLHHFIHSVGSKLVLSTFSVHSHSHTFYIQLFILTAFHYIALCSLCSISLRKYCIQA